MEAEDSAPQRRTRAFTVDEVERMVETGVIGEDEPLQLIDGELITMSPRGPIHSDLVMHVLDLLRAVYEPANTVRPEQPLKCGAISMPEPDAAVIRVPRAARRRTHPTGAEAILVVEVSVSTLALDRRKAGIYAAAGVPVYWLVDVDARRVEVHREPTADGRYRVVEIVDEDGTIAVPDTSLVWTVRDLL
jgi:Uma2 family endonuclease